MKKLQVYLDGKWQYVLCRNKAMRNPQTTPSRRKALDADAMPYFTMCYPGHAFKREGD